MQLQTEQLEQVLRTDHRLVAAVRRCAQRIAQIAEATMQSPSWPHFPSELTAAVPEWGRRAQAVTTLRGPHVVLDDRDFMTRVSGFMTP